MTTEGYAIPRIQARLTEFRFEKLQKCMTILDVPNNEEVSESEKLRIFIDKLYDLLVLKTSSEVSDKPVTSKPEKPPECLSRFEHEGEYYCVNRKAHAQKLATLKICSKCQWKLTKEKAERTGLLLKTTYYPTCGARENYDVKKGLMLYCSKYFGGQWVTPKDCINAKCNFLKKVQTA